MDCCQSWTWPWNIAQFNFKSKHFWNKILIVLCDRTHCHHGTSSLQSHKYLKSFNNESHTKSFWSANQGGGSYHNKKTKWSFQKQHQKRSIKTTTFLSTWLILLFVKSMPCIVCFFMQGCRAIYGMTIDKSNVGNVAPSSRAYFFLKQIILTCASNIWLRFDTENKW